MPSTTFYNLPDDKRERLVLAIKEEFSRQSFDQISINKIIQAAKIPRGSFYQYFTDKNDMLEYILSDYQEYMLEHIVTSLIESNGDIFQMFLDILDFTIEFGTNEDTISFCRNLFIDIQINTGFYTKIISDYERIKPIKELMETCDLEKLDLRTSEDFSYIFEVLMIVTATATVESFLNISECDLVRQKYINKIQLIKRGFSKDKQL